MDESGLNLDFSILDKLTIPEYKPKGAARIEESSTIEKEKTETQDMVQETEHSGVEEDFDIFNSYKTPFEDMDEEVETQEVEAEEVVEESPIKVWAEFASQRGLIDLTEGEEIGDSEEFLINKFNDKVTRVVDKYKEDLPEALRELLNAYEQGVPIEDLMESENRISEFSQIDKEKLTEDVPLQKDIMRAFLKYQDYTDEEIEKKIERLEENLLLEDDSDMALKKLIKIEQKNKEGMIEQSKRAQENRMKEYQQRVDSFKKSVMDKEEIISGIPITKEQKEKIIKMTTQPVSMLKDGTPVTALKKMELEDPDFLTKLAYVAGVLNWDLSTVERKAATTAAKQVKAKVNTYKDSPLSKLDINAIRKSVNIMKKQSFK